MVKKYIKFDEQADLHLETFDNKNGLHLEFNRDKPNKKVSLNWKELEALIAIITVWSTGRY